MAIIDASVYVALINELEEAHESSWAWFERAQWAGDRVLAPVTLLAEVASALSRGLGDAALAHRALRQFARSPLVELVPVTRETAHAAAVIAADHHIRGCDAIYVALAAHLGETLVTLDRRQLERAAGVVAVRRP